MPLQNALPLNATPGFTWSSVAPNQIQELITVYNAEELDTLNQAPETQIAWADQGALTSQGVGIVKVPIRLPQSLGYTPFDYGGTRTYQSLDVAATASYRSSRAPSAWAKRLSPRGGRTRRSSSPRSSMLGTQARH